MPSLLVLAIAPWGESFYGAYMVIGILADTLGIESMMSKAWIATAWAKPLSLWVVTDSMHLCRGKTSSMYYWAFAFKDL